MKWYTHTHKIKDTSIFPSSTEIVSANAQYSQNTLKSRGQMYSDQYSENTNVLCTQSRVSFTLSEMLTMTS